MIFNDSKFNSSWDLYSLNDLGTFARGKSKHRPRNDIVLFENGNIPFIQTGDIKKSVLHIKSCSDFYNDEGLKQSLLWNPNTLCITIAANIADTAILEFPACFPDSIVGFNSNDKTSNYFMHYLFQYISYEIKRRASGSTQDNINIDYLKGLNFRIPKLSEQNKILSILKRIDDKIENNCELAKELLQTAKDIYNSWFIQKHIPCEIPCQNSSFQWENCCMSSIISNIIKGDWGNDNNANNNDIKAYCIRGTDMPCFRDGVVSDLPVRYIKRDHKDRFLKNGDFVVEVSGTPGRSTYINESIIKRFDECLISSNFCQAFSFKNYKYVYWFYFIWEDLFTNGFTSKYAGKTTISNLQFDIFVDSIFIEKPDDCIIESYYDKVSPLFEKIQVLYAENDELNKLKTRLLPLLMTGQVTL